MIVTSLRRAAPLFGCIFALLAGPAGADPIRVGQSLLYPDPPLPTVAELQPYDGTGAGRISGRLNLVMNGTTARLEYRNYAVYLLPAVTWSYVWAYTLGLAGQFDALRVPGFAAWTNKYRRVAVTDKHGNFAFDNVPPGKYIVGTLVRSHITTATQSFTDDPETVTDDTGVVTHYDEYGQGYDDDGFMSFKNGPSESIVHHYQQHTSVSGCNVNGALAAVVSVPAGGGTTNAALRVIGSTYSQNCSG